MYNGDLTFPNTQPVFPLTSPHSSPTRGDAQTDVAQPMAQRRTNTVLTHGAPTPSATAEKFFGLDAAEPDSARQDICNDLTAPRGPESFGEELHLSLGTDPDDPLFLDSLLDDILKTRKASGPPSSPYLDEEFLPTTPSIASTPSSVPPSPLLDMFTHQGFSAPPSPYDRDLPEGQGEADRPDPVLQPAKPQVEAPRIPARRSRKASAPSPSASTAQPAGAKAIPGWEGTRVKQEWYITKFRNKKWLSWYNSNEITELAMHPVDRAFACLLSEKAEGSLSILKICTVPQ